MAQSYTSTGTSAFARIGKGSKRSVLVTGASGRIGSHFARQARGAYQLRLMVQQRDAAAEAIADCGEVVVCDLGDLAGLKRACQGMDSVLHLAACPSPSATWDSLLENNIVGTYHLFAAAKAARCRRVVFASSIHAVSGYPADVQVKTSDPVNPGDLYGVTKCFGEALGRYLAGQEGLSVIALRLGAVQELENARSEASISMLDAFISYRDLHQLICRSIEVENIGFAVLHGLSNNRFKRLDISDARELLGYDPVDDLAEEHPGLKALEWKKVVQRHNLGDPGQQSGMRDDV